MGDNRKKAYEECLVGGLWNATRQCASGIDVSGGATDGHIIKIQAKSTCIGWDVRYSGWNDNEPQLVCSAWKDDGQTHEAQLFLASASCVKGFYEGSPSGANAVGGGIPIPIPIPGVTFQFSHTWNYTGQQGIKDECLDQTDLSEHDTPLSDWCESTCLENDCQSY